MIKPFLGPQGKEGDVENKTDDCFDRQDRIDALCYPTGYQPKLAKGQKALAMMRRLKAAEALAEESFHWAGIAEAWLAHFGEAGLKHAVRCALKSGTSGPKDFCCGWLYGAEAWAKIARYDRQYEAQAVAWMEQAEDFVQGDADACMCAGTWARLGYEQSSEQALRMMLVAEARHRGSADGRDMICEHWVHCFGPTVGGEYARCFRRRPIRKKDEIGIPAVRVAICSPAEKKIGEVVLHVVAKLVAETDRVVDAEWLWLDHKALRTIGTRGFDLVVIVFNPHWPVLPPGARSAAVDLDKLQRLRAGTRAKIIALHNGFAGHTEADLRKAGADLALALPFQPQTVSETLAGWMGGQRS